MNQMDIFSMFQIKDNSTSERTEYDSLVEKIRYHNDLYYNKDITEISDHEYNGLVVRLREMEASHPEWVTKESPTQVIGGVAKREAGVRVTHDVPMLSIMDVFSKQEVEKWVNHVKEVYPDASFSVEMKIDGLSMTIRYEKGADGRLHLKLAETRGDGYIGEDVTANALVIPDVKMELDLPYESLQLRGEVYMSHDNFEKYNKAQEELGRKTAANPRNLAAGTLRQLDPGVTKERGLNMFIFNVQDGPEEMMGEHLKSMDILGSVGVPIVYHKCCDTFEEISEAIDEIADMRGSLDYDIDGAVIKLNDISKRSDFPEAAKYASGHIAYKYPPEEKQVIMDRIHVNVGRTGKLTYTGEIHDKETGGPAYLCGTNVSRVTLHNPNYIKDMKIGIGGTYKLLKSGEIIPKLVGCVEEPVQVFSTPSECPICGSPLVEREGEVDIYCVNELCPAKNIQAMVHFCSRECMDIRGLSEANISFLIENGFVKELCDFYVMVDDYENTGKVTNDKDEELQYFDDWGALSVKNMIEAIANSRKTTFVKFMAGMNIPKVGKDTAATLAEEVAKWAKNNNYSDDKDIIEILVDMVRAHFDFTSVSGFGEVIASSISGWVTANFFNDNSNVKRLLRFLEFVDKPSDYVLNISDESKIFGKTIVVTGTLEKLGRKEAEELIKKNGGKSTGSVSKKTDYLVVGANPGSKLAKANELGIPVLTEEQFLQML